MDTNFSRPLSSQFWSYGGSSPPALRFATWSPGQLAVGVDNRGHRNYYGYFAVTRNTAPANSYVQAVVAPMTAVPDKQQTAETVVAVQTAWTKLTGLINYLVVSEVAIEAGTKRLFAGYAHGYLAHASTLGYYSEQAKSLLTNHKPYIVTIRTDGHKMAQIWIDNRNILDKHNLHLNIEPPFQVYLEVQDVNMRYAAVFYHMSVYTNRTVDIKGLPSGAHLSFSSNGRIWRATANKNGNAHLAFSVPELANVGTLTISKSGQKWVFPSLRLAGGDHWEFGRLAPPLQWLRSVPSAPWLTHAIPT